jgi:hypothetical protein
MSGSESKFCEAHACHYDKNKHRCTNSAAGDTNLCKNHTCRASDCPNANMSGTSFCEAHAFHYDNRVQLKQPPTAVIEAAAIQQRPRQRPRGIIPITAPVPPTRHHYPYPYSYSSHPTAMLPPPPPAPPHYPASYYPSPAGTTPQQYHYHQAS